MLLVLVLLLLLPPCFWALLLLLLPVLLPLPRCRRGLALLRTLLREPLRSTMQQVWRALLPWLLLLLLLLLPLLWWRRCGGGTLAGHHFWLLGRLLLSQARPPLLLPLLEIQAALVRAEVGWRPTSLGACAARCACAPACAPACCRRALRGGATALSGRVEAQALHALHGGGARGCWLLAAAALRGCQAGARLLPGAAAALAEQKLELAEPGLGRGPVAGPGGSAAGSCRQGAWYRQRLGFCWLLRLLLLLLLGRLHRLLRC